MPLGRGQAKAYPTIFMLGGVPPAHEHPSESSFVGQASCPTFLFWVGSGRGLPCPDYLTNRLSTSRFIEPAIDISNFFDPPLPFGVFEIENLSQGPVKVISDIGYLLVQAFEGVAYDCPPRFAKSSSKVVLHSGQVRDRVVRPSSLMRRYSAWR